MKRKGHSYSIAVLDKAFDLLERLQESDEPLSLDALVKESGLARTTVYRILQNLHRRGYVEKDALTGAYRLGLKLLELGNHVKRRQTLRELALPWMEELREKFQETVNLATLHEGEVLYLEILESPHPIRMAGHLGVHDPAHATALGKSMLAYLEDDEVHQILQERGLRRLTRKTLSDRTTLQAELARVRAMGYAVDDEESVEGGRCVGVPIFGPQGKPIAALSISGPLVRIPDKRIPLIARELKKAASEISRQLGYVVQTSRRARGRR